MRRITSGPHDANLVTHMSALVFLDNTVVRGSTPISSRRCLCVGGEPSMSSCAAMSNCSRGLRRRQNFWCVRDHLLWSSGLHNMQLCTHGKLVTERRAHRLLVHRGETAVLLHWS